MQDIFETFRPKDPNVKQYVDYYYLDIKPNNTTNEFQCFPHYNNSISIYQSHIRLENGEIQFEEKAKPFQIFTPIREKVLRVKQLGEVCRIVIVFPPLGIQHFFSDQLFSGYITGVDFFNPEELTELFSTTNTTLLADLLDSFLAKRFIRFENTILERTILHILDQPAHFSVTEIAKKIGISRQHLTRVFQFHMGVSVKKFHEIVIFRSTVNKRLFKDSNENFTKLAYDFNFSDQSHLNKTYKNLTASTPVLFFKKGTLLGKEDTFWHL
ncbi:MAG: AraC family transcriptional regulator [Chitinophagaceae bacterium]|nr:MAG: AraC family transcriptional regulator [Chitinophagaceae bacterium]